MFWLIFRIVLHEIKQLSSLNSKLMYITWPISQFHMVSMSNPWAILQLCLWLCLTVRGAMVWTLLSRAGRWLCAAVCTTSVFIAGPPAPEQWGGDGRCGGGSVQFTTLVILYSGFGVLKMLVIPVACFNHRTMSPTRQPEH